MQMNEVIVRVKEIDWKKHEKRIKDLVQKNPILIGLSVVALLLLVNLIGLGSSNDSHVVERGASVSFQNGRILNDRESTFYYGKERLLSQKAQSMLDGQAKLEARLQELEKKLQEASSQNAKVPASVDGTPLAGQTSQSLGVAPAPSTESTNADAALQLYGTTENPQGSSVTPVRLRSKGSLIKGPDLIAFPVKAETKTEGVMLPAGSYVKAKVLTGVDVPEGKTYPVLMVLDFSYVAPNDHKIDLSGCFMIAKAEGDLSTERVQMQATKMSCVSKKGKMFERDVNGFVADDKDGSFAMKGQVNSKQGRVAAMAFLAGVVDGVGKAVQAAQTTQSTNPLGGGSSMMTGDAGKYAMAGGASNAAGMVAQWYLQQAQNLAPTVAIGSGRDVWIVIKDKVSLPEEFFKKERKNGDEGIYSYFTRVLE
jgi:conjugal transfer pilus assembly protein TraB